MKTVVASLLFFALLTQTGVSGLSEKNVPTHFSLWVWRTDHVLENEAERDGLFAACRALAVDRLYFYLRSDARLCADPAAAGRLAGFLARCAERRIEVWGLLGEPEWITAANTAAVRRAVGRIRDFNAAQPAGHPRLAGIKFDLEPHALAGWKTGGAGRRELGDKTVALVAAARAAAAGALPIWLDCPIQFFNPEQAEFWARLAPQCDGVTLMNYFDKTETVLKFSARVLGQFAKPVEIGIGLKTKAVAPAPGAPPTAPLKALMDRIKNQCAARPNYAGLALHDADDLISLLRP